MIYYIKAYCTWLHVLVQHLSVNIPLNQGYGTHLMYDHLMPLYIYIYIYIYISIVPVSVCQYEVSYDSDN
jgi:hypothetical protein